MQANEVFLSNYLDPNYKKRQWTAKSIRKISWTRCLQPSETSSYSSSMDVKKKKLKKLHIPIIFHIPEWADPKGNYFWWKTTLVLPTTRPESLMFLFKISIISFLYPSPKLPRNFNSALKSKIMMRGSQVPENMIPRQFCPRIPVFRLASKPITDLCFQSPK